MNIKEMTKNLQEFVEDPEKAAIIFKVILKSKDPDIIQRALELYVLLILNHAEDINKALNDNHDREESYEQRIRNLERQLVSYEKDKEECKEERIKRDYDRYKRRKEQIYKWDKWEGHDKWESHDKGHVSPVGMKDFVKELFKK